MNLLLDTANVADIRYFTEYFPIVGVTTNPTILAREGGDIVEKLLEIRNIIGEDAELHVQVTAEASDAIVAEGRAIVKLLDRNGKHTTFVKIPVTPDGLKATKILSGEGVPVTETAILTATEAMLAANAGASYVAPYVSRLENILVDGVGTVADIVEVFAAGGNSTKILAASFKTAAEVLGVALAGADAATISPDVMKLLATHPTTTSSIEGFRRDFTAAFGEVTLGELIAQKNNEFN